MTGRQSALASDRTARTRRRAKDPGPAADPRARIETERIIDRLTAYILGEIELSSPQVSAALGLLKKSLPDLATAPLADPLDRRTIVEVIKYTDAAPPDPE